jgi:choline-sulfatase
MQFFRRFLLILVLAPWAAPATAANTADPVESTKAKPPNIILITLDTTRTDRMGFLGSKRGLTPNLDALAQQSVVFTRAYAQVPLTTPSHAALLTGTYPQFNHVEDMGLPLGKDLPDLPDLLHHRGYHTAAFIGAIILDPKNKMAPGFDRGFDLYDADFHPRKPGESRYDSEERRAAVVVAHALRWLSHHPQGPFFVWLHFFDPHDPYDPPPPFKERYASAPYDGEIAYMDSAVGTLLETLRRQSWYRNSVIAIAADHGEAFGEHGEERHGMLLYDETVHVPVLLKLPGEEFAGGRVDTRVGLVDVAPSLLQAAGIAAPAAMQGQSLFPLIAGAQPAADGKPAGEKEAEKEKDRAIYSESDYAHRKFGWSALHSWRAGKYLYVRAPKRELYDQSSDPEAVKNQAASAPAVADTLDTQLSVFLQKTSGAPAKAVKLDPAQMEKLNALGYLASDSSTPKNSGRAAIDPKDQIQAANRVHRDLLAMQEDRDDQAIADLRDMAAHGSDISLVYFELGRALMKKGRYQEAVPFLRTAAGKDPDSQFPHYELGLVFAALEQFPDALREMQAAEARNPGSAQFHYIVACLQARLLHRPEAEKEFEKALELDPKYFDAYLVYGRLLLTEGHLDAALAKLTRAAQLRPESPEPHKSLAALYDQLGQPAKATREQNVVERLTGDSQP